MEEELTLWKDRSELSRYDARRKNKNCLLGMGVLQSEIGALREI